MSERLQQSETSRGDATGPGILSDIERQLAA